MRVALPAVLLATYLNDHLAAATAARELTRRAAGSNRNSSYGGLLQALADEIEQDRETLLSIMRALVVGVDHLKVIGGWSAEKLGRLKLNGRVLGYSPLSRVVELEALLVGVHGKRALWRSLQQLKRAPLATFDLDALIARAEHQLGELERLRLKAVVEALG